MPLSGNPMSSEDRLRALFDDVVTTFDGICLTCHQGWGNHGPSCGVARMLAALAPDDTTGEGPTLLVRLALDMVGNWNSQVHRRALLDAAARASAKPSEDA